jgi:NADH/F420H2 dehydrogenase subunit C
MKNLKLIKELNLLKNKIPLLTIFKNFEENIVVVSSNNLFFSLNFLKKNFGYQYSILTCISGIDLLNRSYRFCVVYDLLSLSFNNRLRIKTFITETSPIISLGQLYINSNWWEREVWDMYGIYFDQHLDLRRILTDYGFEGHPMRKDFPLSGFNECRYDGNKKRVVMDILELTQDFRLFNFETPW